MEVPRLVSRVALAASWIVCAAAGLQWPHDLAAEPRGGAVSAQVVSLDGVWSLAPDPKNTGRDQRWWEKPAAEAKATKVPWIIQAIFPGYHGVAWYWRDFAAPANPHSGGRYLLRFWAVDSHA